MLFRSARKGNKSRENRSDLDDERHRISAGFLRAQEVDGDDVSGCVIMGPMRQRDRGERRAAASWAAAGPVLGWLGRLAFSLFIFLSEQFLLFLFSVFKTDFQTSPNLFRKICKNTL